MNGWFGRKKAVAIKDEDDEGTQAITSSFDGGLGGFGTLDSIETSQQTDPRINRNTTPKQGISLTDFDDDSSEDDEDDDEDDDQVMDLPGDDASTVAGGPLFNDADYSVAGGADDGTIASFDTRTEDNWRKSKANDFLSDFFSSQTPTTPPPPEDENIKKKPQKAASSKKEKDNSDPFSNMDAVTSDLEWNTNLPPPVQAPHSPKESPKERSKKHKKKKKSRRDDHDDGGSVVSSSTSATSASRKSRKSRHGSSGKLNASSKSLNSSSKSLKSKDSHSKKSKSKRRSSKDLDVDTPFNDSFATTDPDQESTNLQPENSRQGLLMDDSAMTMEDDTDDLHAESERDASTSVHEEATQTLKHSPPSPNNLQQEEEEQWEPTIQNTNIVEDKSSDFDHVHEEMPTQEEHEEEQLEEGSYGSKSDVAPNDGNDFFQVENEIVPDADCLDDDNDESSTLFNNADTYHIDHDDDDNTFEVKDENPQTAHDSGSDADNDNGQNSQFASNDFDANVPLDHDSGDESSSCEPVIYNDSQYLEESEHDQGNVSSHSASDNGGDFSLEESNVLEDENGVANNVESAENDFSDSFQEENTEEFARYDGDGSRTDKIDDGGEMVMQDAVAEDGDDGGDDFFQEREEDDEDVENLEDSYQSEEETATRDEDVQDSQREGEVVAHDEFDEDIDHFLPRQEEDDEAVEDFEDSQSEEESETQGEDVEDVKSEGEAVAQDELGEDVGDFLQGQEEISIRDNAVKDEVFEDDATTRDEDVEDFESKGEEDAGGRNNFDDDMSHESGIDVSHESPDMDANASAASLDSRSHSAHSDDTGSDSAEICSHASGEGLEETLSAKRSDANDFESDSENEEDDDLSNNSNDEVLVDAVNSIGGSQRIIGDDDEVSQHSSTTSPKQNVRSEDDEEDEGSISSHDTDKTPSSSHLDNSQNDPMHNADLPLDANDNSQHSSDGDDSVTKKISERIGSDESESEQNDLARDENFTTPHVGDDMSDQHDETNLPSTELSDDDRSDSGNRISNSENEDMESESEESAEDLSFQIEAENDERESSAVTPAIKAELYDFDQDDDSSATPPNHETEALDVQDDQDFEDLAEIEKNDTTAQSSGCDESLWEPQSDVLSEGDDENDDESDDDSESENQSDAFKKSDGPPQELQNQEHSERSNEMELVEDQYDPIHKTSTSDIQDEQSISSEESSNHESVDAKEEEKEEEEEEAEDSESSCDSSREDDNDDYNSDGSLNLGEKLADIARLANGTEGVAEDNIKSPKEDHNDNYDSDSDSDSDLDEEKLAAIAGLLGGAVEGAPESTAVSDTPVPQNGASSEKERTNEEEPSKPTENQKEQSEGNDSDSSSSDDSSDSDSDDDGKPYKLVVKEAPLLRLENVTSMTRSKIPVEKIQKKNKAGGTWGSLFSSFGLTTDVMQPSTHGSQTKTPSTDALSQKAEKVPQQTRENNKVKNSEVARADATAISTNESKMTLVEEETTSIEKNSAEVPGADVSDKVESSIDKATSPETLDPEKEASSTATTSASENKKKAKKEKKERKKKKKADEGGLGSHFKKNVRKVSRYGDDVSVGTTTLKKATGAEQQHVVISSARTSLIDESNPAHTMKGFRPWESEMKQRKPADMPRSEKGVNSPIVEEFEELDSPDENEDDYPTLDENSVELEESQMIDSIVEESEPASDSENDEGDDQLASLSALESALKQHEEAKEEENFDDMWDTLSADVSTAIEFERKQRENFRKKREKKGRKKQKKKGDDPEEEDSNQSEMKRLHLFDSNKKKSGKKKHKKDKDKDKFSSEFLSAIREVFNEDSEEEHSRGSAENDELGEDGSGDEFDDDGSEKSEASFFVGSAENGNKKSARSQQAGSDSEEEDSVYDDDKDGNSQNSNPQDEDGSDDGKSKRSSYSRKSSRSRTSRSSHHSSRMGSSSKPNKPKMNPAAIMEAEMKRSQGSKSMSISSLKQEMSDRRGTSTNLLKKEFEQRRREREAAAAGWNDEPVVSKDTSSKDLTGMTFGGGNSGGFGTTQEISMFTDSSLQKLESEQETGGLAGHFSRWDGNGSVSELDDLKTIQHDAYSVSPGSVAFGDGGGLLSSGDGSPGLITSNSPLGSFAPGGPMGSLNAPPLAPLEQSISPAENDGLPPLSGFGGFTLGTITEDIHDDNERGLLAGDDDDGVSVASSRKASGRGRFSLKAPKIGLGGVKKILLSKRQNGGSSRSIGNSSDWGNKEDDYDDNESLLG